MASITVSELATHTAFVVLAYLFAFGILTAASLFDFVSSTWRTVYEVRVRGLAHLGALIIAMFYMMAYIVIHGLGGEKTEMSAGILALLLACVDFCRTLVGLWQLHIFRQWVASCIGSLESLGYVAKWEGGTDFSAFNSSMVFDKNARKRALAIADCVMINDTIVENRLSEGDVKCYLKQKGAENHPSLKHLLLIPIKGVTFLVHVPWIISSILFSQNQAFTNPGFAFYLNPRTPEDVWMKWACVLVGQVFPEWLDDMKSSGISGFSGEMVAPERVLRFTRGILCSGALHTQNTSDSAMSTKQQASATVVDERQNVLKPHSFLRFGKWEEYPKLRQGLFSEQEFLAMACRTGSGLPFGVAHVKSFIQGPEGVEYGYKRFKSKLARIIESFPVERAEALEGFGTCELEWLAVFLSIETWNADAAKRDGQDIKREDTAHHMGSVDAIGRRDSDSTSSDGMQNGCDLFAKYQASSVALEHLQMQLGIQRSDSEYAGPSVARFPLIKTALQSCFLRNRNVLETSVHIDNTLALCAGNQYAFMRMNEEETEARISNARASLGLGEFEGSFPVAELVTETKIEKERLLYQFVCEAPEFSSFEQRMTFLGCSMENVRSSLARWVQNNPDADVSVWASRVPRLGNERIAVFEFQTSDSFSQIAYRCIMKGSMAERHCQMRLVWELQSYFHSRLPENGVSPESPVAMVLCILSFPALEVEVAREAMHDVKSRDTVTHIPDGVSVSFENQVGMNLTISVPLGPDPLHVNVSLTLLNEANVNAAVWISPWSSDGECMFRWQKWRDAFTGRLEGMMLYQKTHGLPWTPVVRTSVGIGAAVQKVRTSGTATGKEMNFWVGWPPHRASMCLFEVESKDFIVQTVSEDVTFPIEGTMRTQFSGIVKSRYKPVPYESAERTDLEHASVVAREVISWIMQMDACTTALVEIRGEDLLKRAGDNQEGEKGAGLEWRLKIWEAIAAQTQRFEVLESAIRILCEPGNSTKYIRRATKLIESFCSLVGTKVAHVRTGCAVMMFKDDDLSKQVMVTFKWLISKSAADPSVLGALSRLCTSFENYRTYEFFEFACVSLCQGILHLYFTSSRTHVGTLVRQFGSILGHMRPKQQALPFLLVSRGAKGLNYEALGNQVLFGRNVPPCPELAASVFCVGAIEAKDSKCTTWLGVIYQRGAGNIFPCAVQASELYRRAIEEGNDRAPMNTMANVLETGAEGVNADSVRAVELDTRAVSGENISAMNTLARFQDKGGEGV